ncbi:MAG: DUF427 domain-containing protein [Methylobacteriaceae bacterium]|nr:DUF427 domain-containing protein [Methylobacteriaceae bacterium]
MAAAQHKIPGPDHPITISPAQSRVRVRFGGEVIADANAALDLKESTYPVVHYIPRSAVKMDRLEKTSHSTHCPYKGDASYFSIVGKDGTRVENAVWSYETPFPAVKQIAGHLAFYPNKVEISAD